MTGGPPNVEYKDPDVSVDVRRRCDWLLRIKPVLQGALLRRSQGQIGPEQKCGALEGNLHAASRNIALATSMFVVRSWKASAFLGSHPAPILVGTWQVDDDKRLVGASTNTTNTLLVPSLH